MRYAAAGDRNAESRSRLESLRHIVQAVNSAPDLAQALQIIVQRTRQALQVDACAFYLTEHERRRHVLMAADGLHPDIVGRLQFKFGEGLIGLVADRTEPLHFDEIPADRDAAFVAQSGEEPYRGFLGVPVTHQGKVLGVLAVRQRTRRRFHDADMAFLVTLAAQLGGTLAYVKASGYLCEPISSGEHPIDGLAGAPGVALGTAVVIFPPAALHAVPDRLPEDPCREETTFRAAVKHVAAEMKRLGEGLDGALPAAHRALFEAYAMLLQSPELVSGVVQRIHAGNWVPGALRETVEAYARHFEAMEDPYLRERGQDLRDLGTRLLMHLQEAGASEIDYPLNTVLVGQELSAIELAQVPAGRLAGVVSAQGSALSHVAILARALGVPAIMGVGRLPLVRLEGRELALDGDRGRVYIQPSPLLREEFARLTEEERALSEELKGLRELPAETPDGARIALYANAGLLEDIAASREAGAEGIGLYRTELPFMLRERFPSEEEQRVIYRQVLEAFAPRPVTLRILDIGGDKPLAYFPVQEENPMLGWRGIRVLLDHPELFLTQLRAALRAAVGLGNLNLLLPVISGVAEVEEAQRLLGQAYGELIDEGVPVSPPPLGLMIEVPSAVYQAEALARRADFLSVGTNDLTQYLLGVDRGNRRVAKLLDPLHPSVLQALAHVVEAAHRAGKPVCVCGESAGDPAAALLLLGMGFDGLSVSVGSLLRTKCVIRSFTWAQAQALVQRAMRQDRPEPIRELLVEALRDAGLGRLLRGQEQPAA
jgi:phosphotransferase system enzyme I (PtsP)